MNAWQSSLLNEIPWLAHGTATRDFGSTRYPKEGETDTTAENRARFLGALGLDPSRLVVSGNVHGNRVEPVSDPGFVPNCDGLISSEPGLVLGTKSADCLPLFFVDPTTRTVAIAHVGWKGVAAGIAIEAVQSLVRNARLQGKKPGVECGVLVAIGPSVGACHYRVQPDRRADMLARTPFILPDDFADGRVDLRAIVVRQLAASGVLPAHIDASAPCTACEPERFWSYVLLQDASEGMLSVISRRQ